MNTRQKITCLPMETFSMERVRYFARQLITPEDLTLEQEYFRNKLRRHNRFLHGWGVVCGCTVEPVPDKPWTVKVTPGYVLGPYGDEILIDHEVEVDLHKEGLEGLAVSPCADQLDDWCSQVEVERVAGQPLYVAVKYAECRSRPVRVLVGCGCDETHCEYSRIRDSFAIEVLTSKPSTYSDPLPCYSSEGGISPIPCGPCPPCPTDPWVILATVTPGDNGKITEQKIDNFSLRRCVVSLAGICLLAGKLLWIGFIPNTNSKFFRNSQIHEALSSAIDRGALQEVLPPGYKVDPTQPFDPEKAKEILAELGLEGNQLSTVVGEKNRKLAKVVGVMLENVELTLALTVCPDSEVVDKVTVMGTAGELPDIVIGDESLASELAAVLPDFDGTLIRF